MKVVGFAGYSGSGKTTLLEQLIVALRGRGLRVSVVKHAHHGFDIDHEGKDSWRHRKAGASEVLIASDRRWALMREYEQACEPQLAELLAALDPRVDWVLVEGFKHAELPKIELLRGHWPDGRERPPLFPHDPCIVAIASDGAPLQAPADLPVLDVRDPAAIVRWLLANAQRFERTSPP